MAKGIDIKIERDFGDIIGDGMKVVFRNLRYIFPAILIYAFPFIGLSLIVMIITGAYKYFLMMEIDTLSDPSYYSTSYAIIILGMAMGFIMINLVVYASIMDYHENSGHISFQGIKQKITRNILNYLVSVTVEGLILGSVIILMISALAISPLLFSLIYLAGLILLFWLFNIVQFLGLVRIEEGLSISQGLERCMYLLKNNWWNTFGVILVASFIGTILMYAFVLPVSIIIGLVSALHYESAATESEVWLSIFSGVFTILYGLVAILSNMYIAGVRALKYYDLIEKKEANILRSEIEKIGTRDKSSSFENEGDF